MSTPTADDFDPTLYGMAASYDDQGNYLYPDGFDPETGEWLDGYEEQRRPGSTSTPRLTPAGKRTRSRSRTPRMRTAPRLAPASYSSTTESATASPTPAAPEGSLASDEALQALREKLTGGAS